MELDFGPPQKHQDLSPKALEAETLKEVRSFERCSDLETQSRAYSSRAWGSGLKRDLGLVAQGFRGLKSVGVVGRWFKCLKIKQFKGLRGRCDD